MLQLVYGTAGTGKSTYLINQIGTLIAQEKQVILLVPEQFSFESERRLYQEFGPKSSLYVEVLNFTRLCNSIFRKFGGLGGTPVSSTAKYLLMSVAVQQLQDHLQVYRKSTQNTSFLETLLSACSEFKTAGVTPEQLEAFAEETTEGKLKDKLGDLSLIYSAYQALLETGYTDPEDDLMRACQILENNNYFQEYHVFVDGFTTFMTGEFEFLQHVLRQSKQVTMTFTTNSLIDSSKGTGVFSVVQQAIQKITKMAETQGVEIEDSLEMEKPMRYTTPDLKHLSKEFLQLSPKLYEKEQTSIIGYKAADSYEELQMVASQIQKLVREKGYRYREIAVITRDPAYYGRGLELIFSQYGIPYFADETLDVENSPLIFGVLAALHVIQNNFSGESVLFLAKSPLMGLPLESVAKLENYSYMWDIKGKLWQSDFLNNPRGLVEHTLTIDEDVLKEINGIREILITPLNKLKIAIEQGNGYHFAKGIYDFLEEISATKHLTDYAQGLDDTEKEQFLSINAQLWDTMMEILDVFGQVLGETAFDRNRLIELFRLAVGTTEIGIIPQTLDQVLVGGADRIRPGQMRAVFVIGANEGVFPGTVGNFGVFSDMERQNLVESGLEIAKSGIHQALLERFYAYFACTLASEKLYVSYCLSDLKGGEKLPSVIISQLEQIFPVGFYQCSSPIDLVEGEASALALLSTEMRKDTSLRATLWELFAQDQSVVLEKMKKASWKENHVLRRKELATGLFGSSMHLSPSRVERFYKCPFSYFAQDGLKLKKRKRVEFSPLESGSLIHHVLQLMMEQYGGKGLYQKTLKELEEEVSVIIMNYLESRIEETKTLPQRFTYLFKRLCGTLAKLLHHLGKEFSQSLYEPVAFELPISQKDGVKPITLVTPEGITITVEGVVDRVDLMEKNGEKYIRVVDYKSGSKDFKLYDVLYGLNLQMLLYLFTIQENGTGVLENTIPAGVLYMPVKESYMSVDRNTDPSKAQAQLEKQWVMSGLLLNDEDALRGMEEELAGVFIPAKVGKDGELSAKSSVANQEELGRIGKQVKEEIVEMANLLSDGHILSYPVNDKEYATCSYCDYKVICGYEEGDPIREVTKLSPQQVLEILEEKEKNNGK